MEQSPRLIEDTQAYAPELTLQDYIRILDRGKVWIILSAIVVLAVSTYYTFTVTPEYNATTTVLIKNVPEAATIFDFSGGMSQSRIANEIELIKSRTIAEAVVKTLWDSKHRNRLNVFETRIFKPRGQRPRRLIREIITLGLYNPEASNPKHYEEPYTPAIGKKFAGRIRNGLTVTNRRDTDMLNITYNSPFPDEAALIANTIAKMYQQADQQWSADQALSLMDFIKEQVAAKEVELAIAEEKIKSYKETEKIFDLTGNATMLLSQLVDAEGQYYNTVAEINIAREQIQYIRERLSTEEETLANQLLNSINAQVFALRQEISSKEGELVRNASIYGEKHDAVQATRRQIEALKKNLDEQTRRLIDRGLAVADPIEYRQELITSLLTAEALLAGQKARSHEYKKLVDLYNNQLNTLPLKQLEFARLERDRSVLSQTYEYMRQKLEEARISVASEAGKVQIIDSAIVPGGATKPNHKRNLLLGLILGLGLGIGIVFLQEYLDRTIKTLDFIERFGLSVLGVIPVVGGEQYSRKKKKRKKGGSSGRKTPSSSLRRRLITREDPKSPVSESYRTLRTNILYSQADKQIKSILVSSPGPGEGKTTTVTNLAITFANMGKQTLLLDTDLRRPVIHRIFDIKKEPGITYYLTGANDDFNNLIHKTDVENLYVVTAGVTPPNPSELLGSERMTELVAKLEKEWDFILMDSPPLVAVTDAAMISREIDSLVLVIKAAETNKDAFRRAVKSLLNVHLPLAGVVMNGISRKTSHDTYYYYYQYYYHYYGKGED